MNYFISKTNDVYVAIKVDNSDLEIIAIQGSSLAITLDCLQGVTNQDVLDTLTNGNNMSISSIQYEDIRTTVLSNLDLTTKKNKIVSIINTLRQ